MIAAKLAVAALSTLVLTASAGCSNDPQVAAAASPATTTVADVDAAAPVPHGDHNPHHGGIVMMTGELHFEVVLDRSGRHRIFFSDATRADLPASVASSVAIIVARPDGRSETLSAQIDETGESWRADGAPISEEETSARISFIAAGEPYWIDIPFMPAEP